MIEIEHMPLYWRFKDRIESETGMPPARAPFIFDFEPNTGLLIEQRSPELEKLLLDIYAREANVGFLQDGHSLLETYGADFWRFLCRLLEEFPSHTVLEIGCGGCVLLERLKKRGCDVLGVDPSPFAVEAGKRKGIDVIQEFFPCSELGCAPDMIFQVDVLEHIDDPVTFLKRQAETISDDGLVVVNVPDCSESIELGDVSMALHQHVNMFDGHSLTAVFNAAGLEVVKLERSKYGSALYCAARKSSNVSVSSAGAGQRWNSFEQGARRAIQAFEECTRGVQQSGKSIGFFMPQRAFPYLGTMNWFEGYRVFDNMNVWHGRYLDGLDVAIENQEDLVENPVEHLFIMSLTFGSEVADALFRDVPAMSITTLKDILEAAGNCA